jgi:hypothetical protein
MIVPSPRARGRLERVGQRLGDDQRVVAAGGKRLRQALEHPAAVVIDGGDLAVHQLGCAHDAAAEGGADPLVPEADAEHGALGAKPADDVHRNAGILRASRPRRDDDPLRPELGDLVEVIRSLRRTSGGAPSSPKY